jgi:DNA-binding IclR family transcriptional regulator
VIILPCVSQDGKPTKSGLTTLSALKSGASTPEVISEITGQPLFKIRSGLRELINAGFVKQVDEKHQLTLEGSKLIP